MQAFSIEDNYRETGIRAGPPLGAFYKPAAADITADTWYRLMPSGNTASAITDKTVEKYHSRLDIGDLRADIEHMNLHAWQFHLLSAGYTGKYLVQSYNSSDNNIILASHEFRENVMKLHNIPGNNIEWTMYPTGIVDFKICLDADATDTVEIGWSATPIYAPTDITSMGYIKPGKLMRIPFNRYDMLFFKFETVTSSAENYMTWGEHYIS